MSQGKFRLTKQIRENESITKKIVEIRGDQIEVKYMSNGNQLDFSKTINDYNKKVQIIKRYEQFKNPKVKNRNKILLSKNDDRSGKSKEIYTYNNRYFNDVPLSMSIHTNQNKQIVYKLIEEAVNRTDNEQNYATIIDEVFTALITKKLFSYQSSKDKIKTVKSVTPNKFISLMMEEKKSINQIS